MGKETIGIKNKIGANSNIKKIDENMYYLAKEIKSLSENLKAMMTGNAEGPYWNGAKAKAFYEVAVKNLQNNINDYQTAYIRLSKYAERYNIVVKLDNGGL